jgi:hypothetical protein
LTQVLGPHSGPYGYGKAVICRVRCADQRIRGLRDGRDDDQGRAGGHGHSFMITRIRFLTSGAK